MCCQQARYAVFSMTGPTQRLQEPAVKTVGDVLSKMWPLIESVASDLSYEGSLVLWHIAGMGPCMPLSDRRVAGRASGGGSTNKPNSSENQLNAATMILMLLFRVIHGHDSFQIV